MNGPELSAHTCQADVRTRLTPQERPLLALVDARGEEQPERCFKEKYFREAINLIPSQGEIVLRAQDAFTREVFERFLRSQKSLCLLHTN